MLEVNFEEHYTSRWARVQEYFPKEYDPWDMIKTQTRNFMKSVIEEITQSEFSQQIKADYYQDSPQRCDYRNGTRTRSLKTSFGAIKDMRVPRGRKSGYQFKLFKRYQRKHEEVDTAVLWATLCGMSNTRTTEFFHGFLQTDFSSATVINILKKLDEQLQAFRTFPIALNYPYLLIDGLAIHILEGGILTEKVVIFAMGIDQRGQADILAFRLSDNEGEEQVKALLNDLFKRGLTDVKLIVHDGAPGIKAAADWVYPYAQHQRCVFHKQMNLIQNIKQTKNKKPMLKESKKIFKATSKKEALRRAQSFKAHWQRIEPKASASFFQDFELCLTYFNFPKAHWPWLKTNNYLELYFKNIRRRIRNIGCFRNRFSAERYLFGLTKLIGHQLDTLTANSFLHTFC
jgi:putative transposase